MKLKKVLLGLAIVERLKVRLFEVLRFARNITGLMISCLVLILGVPSCSVKYGQIEAGLLDKANLSIESCEKNQPLDKESELD